MLVVTADSAFERVYAGEALVGARVARLNPGCAEELGGLAPAIVITAGFDPLRDEGERYAERLRDAGVPTVLRRFEALVHGFATLAGVSPSCSAAVGEVAGLVPEQLAAARVRRSRGPRVAVVTGQ